jgi:hypothetical protein
MCTVRKGHRLEQSEEQWSITPLETPTKCQFPSRDSISGLLPSTPDVLLGKSITPFRRSVKCSGTSRKVRNFQTIILNEQSFGRGMKSTRREGFWRFSREAEQNGKKTGLESDRPGFEKPAWPQF